MLMADLWSTLMTEEGVEVAEARDGGDVVLAADGLPPTSYTVRSSVRALTPSAVDRFRRDGSGSASAPGPRLLLLAPAVSARAARAATGRGISFLRVPAGADAVVSGTLIADDGTRLDLGGRVEAAPTPRPPGRVPWAAYDAAFQLLAEPASSQAALAARVGVSQPRIAQIMARWEGRVTRTEQGWTATPGLRQWLVTSYPPSGRVRLTYLTLDPLVPLAERLSSRLREHGVEHAVSGDVAADRLAPWARPQALHVWARSAVDLTADGVTPAPEAEANVVVQIPEDPYLLRRTRRAGDLTVLAPWRVWLDLAQRGQDEAAEHLASAIADGRVQP